MEKDDEEATWEGETRKTHFVFFLSSPRTLPPSLAHCSVINDHFLLLSIMLFAVAGRLDSFQVIFLLRRRERLT